MRFLKTFLSEIMTIPLLLILIVHFSCNETTPTSPASGGSWTVTDSNLLDPDGNLYTTITIGNQVWTVENLRTTQYKDGTPIPHVSDEATWSELLYEGAYCYFHGFIDNNKLDVSRFGLLYNWFAVDTDNLAPDGWHVPAKADWETLINYLVTNGYNYDGTTDENKVAKSLAAKTDWQTSSKIGAIGNDLTKNNSSGFCALPGGMRSANGVFCGGGSGSWWSTISSTFAAAYYFDLSNDTCALRKYAAIKGSGLSIRLIKD